MILLRTIALVLVAMAVLAPAVGAALLGSGRPLDRAFAARLVVEELRAAGLGEQFEVRIDQPLLPLGNPGDSETEVVIEALERDARSGRFEAQLVGRVDGVERFRLPLHGRAPALIELPVLVRPIARGELIGAADLDWQTIPASRIGARTLTDPEQLIGAEARRRLQPGRSLSARDLGPPRLVRRGQPVRLVYARAGLQLQALGTAMADGELGALVSVANSDSRRTLQGVVSGPDQVTVGPPAAP